jgi:hypothetical protein
MKKLFAILLAFGLLSTGCGLIPKKVEFFQDKVKKFPAESSRLIELQKEAAYAAKVETQQTVRAAVLEDASTNLVQHAETAAVLTDAVSTSLGPPSKQPSETVAADLRRAVAKLDAKIDAFKQENDENAGKKIEGTGAIQVPYFAYLGGFVVLVFMLWHLGKLALTAASVANPGAAVGLGVMNVAGSLAGKGFVQLVQGGKNFLKWVDDNVPDDAIRTKLVDAFTAAHKQAQDGDVRPVVDKLRK